ncbi:helix-turn-helix transcriptional regulator [Hylemonella gracilis]|uniref:AraC family transcriptional regulator n=1 Tax=Hylemonella gracilis ATCC 19624 TaxID=887062 RepID=F3KSQ4_9BURK|nr:helix-turn-helix transcriptional regulator [Hylemonella gracilis]EGI77123.1 AraC family transcriptional regulator [Hylemonella gracilis ATCC 19624]
MNAAPTPGQLLLARLQELSSLGSALPCLCLRAVHAHHIKAVEVVRPTLIIPLQGTKRCRERGAWMQVQPGHMLLVPGARNLDMENIPDAQGGDYTAIAIGIETPTLEAARQLLQGQASSEPGHLASVALDDVAMALLHWADTVQQGETVFACHAMVGVVLRLHALGHGGLLAPVTPSLADQIRAMVVAEPARDWSSSDIEQALGLSGATLRRQLAASGTSLRELITGARLAQALTLLQSTRLPVKSVAMRVGYASTASFSKRFAERYGVEPSRVGSV